MEEEKSIELVIREKDEVVEKAENLINEHHGPIQSIIEQTPDIVKSEKELRINSEQKYKVAADCLGLVKGHLKTIESRRKLCLEPFATAAGLINAHAKKITIDLIKVKISAEDKIRVRNRFLKDEKKKADALLLKQAEDAAAKNEPIPVQHFDTGPAPTPEPVPKTIKTDINTTSMSDNWKWDAVDLAKFYQHVFETKQFELIQINPVALNAHVKLVKNSRLIPGINIYNKESIATRSK